jgi:DNA-binding NarL/FixJ family response regulator
MATPAADPSIRTPLTRVVLMGGNADDRLLLRGLLRLHRHRVAAEIEGSDGASHLAPSDERKVLILQADSRTPDWPDQLTAALTRDPSLLAMVLTPARSAEFDRRAAAAGAHAVLLRPFAVKNLIATVEAVARGENLLTAIPSGDPPPSGQG